MGSTPPTGPNVAIFFFVCFAWAKLLVDGCGVARVLGISMYWVRVFLGIIKSCKPFIV